MTEEPSDKDQKTEEATPHRLQEAFKKGQVALSREVIHLFSLISLGIGIVAILPLSLSFIREELTLFLLNLHQFSVEGNALRLLLTPLLISTLICFLPLGLFLLITPLGAGFLQTRLAIQWDAIMPKFDRISPSKGIKRLFSSRTLIDFLKNLGKLISIGICLFFFLKPKVLFLSQGTTLLPDLFFPLIKDFCLKSLMVIICMVVMISILDYLYQKFEFLKNLRMTKEEIKKEFKDTEGDPLLKQRQRQFAQKIIRKNMMTSIPQATVIITNPTHYSVALEYKPDQMNAPLVIAKGVDFIALKIQEIARTHKIPIIQNPPVARALYKGVDLTQEIPPEHYKAVAEIINLVMGLKKNPFPL